MSPLTIDQEFRALIPALTAEERHQLESNLKTDGCRDPLVVWNGLLLDGHHRYEICTQAALPYQTVEQPCADRDAAKIWIIQHQFGRRNLNMAQRAELAMQLEPLIAAQIKTKEHLRKIGQLSIDASPIEATGTTNGQLAAIAGISEPSMTRAAAVFKRGTPELQDAMRSGKLKVSAAYDRLKAGEAIVPPARIVKPYTHKQTIRKESDVSARLQELLKEFRQKRKANHDDMQTRKWIPSAISAFRQKEIMDWLEVALDRLVRQLQAPMPSASGTPAKKSRPSTSTGEEDHGHQETPRTTH